MSNITDLLTNLGELKSQNNDLYKKYKEGKEVEDALKEDLRIALDELGTKTFKNDKFVASFRKDTNIVIEDEQALMEWLRNTPDVEADLYIGVKKTMFTPLAKSMLKGTGELADGTSVEIKESLVIGTNKETE